jgi:hypothetical protein
MGKRYIQVQSLPFTGKNGENCLCVSVDYSAGGNNWYSGEYDPGGFYCHVTPATETGDSISSNIGAGGKILLRPAGRFNAKTLEELARSCMERQDAQRLIGAIAKKYGK